MSTKRTFQPKRVKKVRKFGFRRKMSTKKGRDVLKRRKNKGEKKSSLCNFCFKCKQSMAIASKFRIKGNRRIEEVKKEGKVLQSENFGAVYLENKGSDCSRFAFVVSTKISKLAVHRNGVERAISEAVRREMKNIPVGYDVVFLAKKSVSNKTTEEIMKEVEKFIKTFKP